MVDVVQRWYFLRWHSNKKYFDRTKTKWNSNLKSFDELNLAYIIYVKITLLHTIGLQMPILTDTLLDVNPRTVFNDWLWKLAWLTKLEKDSSKQTTSNTTQLKKDQLGHQQTKQSKLNLPTNAIRVWEPPLTLLQNWPISQTNVKTFDLETTLHLTLLTSA